MSKARFILNRIRGSNTEGTSEATRYIARSDLEREREGKDLRKLFSDDRNELSHYEADRWLTAGGARPDKRDLIHYVLSLQEPADYERLGANDKDRQSSLRETVRRVMRTAESAMQVVRLHWVAGIHLNTDNPHVHLVISRYALERDTEKLRRFGKLPHRIAPHNERQPDGTKAFVHGALLDVFAEQIEARQFEHTRQIEAEKARTQVAHDTRERTQTHERTRDKEAFAPTHHVPDSPMIKRGEAERLTAPTPHQRLPVPREAREPTAETETRQRGKEVHQTHVLAR